MAVLGMVLETVDARLKDAILKALRDDVRVNEAEIGVAVEHGVVTLTGRVGSEPERVAAQEVAHRTAGVLDVANEIRVKPTFALGRSDSDLAEDVRAALERALHAAAGGIHSTVRDACVTLDGTVALPRDRQEAERAVRRLSGVLRVENGIVIRAEHGGGAR
jgi:osmotically-inducible protein OsmY